MASLKKDTGELLKVKKVRFKNGLDTEKSGKKRCSMTWESMIARRKDSSHRVKSRSRPEFDCASNFGHSSSKDVIEPSQEFEVEAILDHKTSISGEYLYLLKWKGYSEADNTWEPSSNLFCTDLLNAYKQKHGLHEVTTVPQSLGEPSRNHHITQNSPGVLTQCSRKNTKQTSLEHKFMNTMDGTSTSCLDGRQVWHSSKRKEVGKCCNREKKQHHQCTTNSESWCMQVKKYLDRKNRKKAKELIVQINLRDGITVTPKHHKSDDPFCSASTSSSKESSKESSKSHRHKSQANGYIDHLPNGEAHPVVESLPNGLVNSTDLRKKVDASHQDDPCDGTLSDPKQTPLSTSAEYRLRCCKHDHPYCTSYNDKPPVPNPAPPLNTSHSHSDAKSGVFKVEISPPPSPSPPSPISPLPLTRKELKCDSVIALPKSDHYLSDDSIPSPSPLVACSPTSEDTLKLYLSASSSDLDISEKDDGKVAASENSSKLQSHLLSAKTRYPHKVSKQSLSLKDTRALMRNKGVLPRWRKGPVPLPRSFSKRQSGGAPELQTKAAKVQFSNVISSEKSKHKYSENDKFSVNGFHLHNGRVNGHNDSHHHHQPNGKKSILFENGSRDLIKPRKVKPSLAVDSHSHSVVPPASQQPRIPIMKLNLSPYDYKDQLMNWQYELNKQRDGTDDIIYVENEIDMVPPPDDFNYICSNKYAEGVPNPNHPDMVSSLCGCECYYLGRKCGPKSEFCCAHMAGSKFAYTLAGKVKVPPGTPIYECNAKCSCPSDCSNRIVQLGRKIPLCIFRTVGRGWGVKCICPIKANTFVTEYVGEVITNEEAERRGKMCDARGITYLFDLDFEDENSAFTIDAATYGNISHFFNHSCDPNLIVYSVWIDTLDKRLPRLAFFTTRNISMGEELTFDYQMNRSPNSSGERIPCLCGSSNCLGYIN